MVYIGDKDIHPLRSLKSGMHRDEILTGKNVASVRRLRKQSKQSQNVKSKKAETVNRHMLSTCQKHIINSFINP